MATAGEDNSVVIAGGGLAGLLCALSLGRAGARVTLCEAAGRFGGKAGADLPSEGPGGFPLPIEHGPHFVAAWYRNVLGLLRTLGIEDRLVPFDAAHFLLPSNRPESPGRALPVGVRPQVLSRALRAAVDRRRGDPIAWPVAVQSAGLALDLLALPDDPQLDELSVAEFVRSRWYGGEALAGLVHDQLLRGSSVAAELASAQTLRRLTTLWLRDPHPVLSVLDRDIETGLIEPLARAVADVAEVRAGTPVERLLVEDGAVAGLRLAGGEELRGATTVSAVPLETLRGWIGDRDAALDPRLRGLERLRSAPMTAMHLVFDRRLRGIPPGVVYLWEARPPINLIDLGQAWGSLAASPWTVLSVVLGGGADLQGLSDQQLVDVVLGELQRYLPDATPARLRHVAVCANVGAPLFLNTVGSWRDRPRPDESYGGGRLYVTGDYTRNAVDIACMEGAALAGLSTARAIAARQGRRPGIEPLPPRPHSPMRRGGYRVARAALAPALALGARAARTGGRTG